ncbi:MAG: insulinase family protein [Proteobacteria bacterium]|nr:insulinase family protein [Pseudomonadota bacterium]
MVVLNRRLAALIAASMMAAAPALAAELEIPYEMYELPNGLEVILSEDHATPVVHVEVWYHVGSKDEVQGRSGFAHLFEHLMFNGSEHWDDEYFAPLQPYGARINGSTNTERTNYFETVPSNVTERALWLEADRMGWLLPALTVEKLDNQRDVVRNERRQNYEIRPYAKSRKALAEAMYPPMHPYHRLTIGTHEDLEAATLDDVKGFFTEWYVPNNATLTVVGDFDSAEVKGWIEQYFGPIPGGPQPSSLTEAPFEKPAPATVTLTDDVQLPRLYLSYPSPAFYADGDADLDVLSSVLTDGKSSRLYKRLVFEDRIAKDVSAGQYSRGLASTYNITATAAPGHTVEELQAAIDEELATFLAEGPTETEVETAINNWQKYFYGRLEGVAGIASLLHNYNHHLGDPGKVQFDLDRYLAVTPASVLQWAGEVLDPNHRITVIVEPAPEPAPEGDAPKGDAQ